MDKPPFWKPLLILAICALSALSLYPLDRRLRPGLDLAGGTTLMYQVNLPPDSSDSQREITDTISVLQQRVDPTGVRNLVWRQQTGNRIEIQMATASAAAAKLRKDYTTHREALLASNITARQLDSVLRSSSAQRSAALKQLAGGQAERGKLLDAVAQAYDQLESARAQKDRTEAAKREAEGLLKALLADAPAERKQERDAAFRAALKEAIAKATAFNKANEAYKAAREAVLATNVEPAELERVLALSNMVDADAAAKNAKALSPRAEAAEALAKARPDRAKQITDTVDAYGKYEAVKGPLDDPNDLIQLLRGSGVLEFRIAARPNVLPDEAQYRQQLVTRGPRAGGDKQWRWHVIDDVDSYFEDTKANADIRAVLMPEDNIRDEAWQARVREALSGRGMVGQVWANEFYMLLGNGSDNSLTAEKKEWKVESAFRIMDQMSGLPAVSFSLDARGGEYMGALTGGHINEQMAIVLDGRVISAPNIQGRISGHGQITGGRTGFKERELDYLIRTLKAGSLKARLSEAPISIQTTGPAFGQENLAAGLRACAWALVLVSIFMVGYYFFLGGVAVVTLLLNMLLILAAMATLEATFTMPGIAGIVLTIGMAVDANVLVYERIREELERKASLTTAIRLGYEKAMSTIVDANLTTLITCIILGYTATADVKGFAVTLGIGLIANVFTAVFCARVITESYVAYFRPSRLRMLALVVPKIREFLTPNIDWVGKRYLYIGISAVLTVGGITGVWVRGIDFLDIEFLGGTQVTFQLANVTQADLDGAKASSARPAWLAEGQNLDASLIGKPKTLSIAEVKRRLGEASKKPELEKLKEVTPVTVGVVEGGRASAFTIQTLAENVSAVSNGLKEAFGDVLETQRTITFAGAGEGAEAPPITQAPAFPIRESQLGGNIGRPSVQTDVTEYLGGVALVLDQLDPPSSIEDVQNRINRTRFQPEYEKLGFRQFTVIGLEQASADEAGSSAAPGTTIYKSVAVLSHEDQTNYAENPDQFTDSRGLAATEWSLVRDALRRDTSLGSVSNFTSQVSDTMKQQAIVAIVLSWLAIMAYIWFRFGSIAYGIGAVVALIHDVITALGMAAWAFYIHDTAIGHALLLQPFRLDLAMVAALLTLIGYSVNDTIVVFDRIRENRGRLAFATPQIINDSINQTISRSILTVTTVLVSMLVLYAIGGAGVHGFAFIMLTGGLVGCYSSIAVASPLLLIGHMGAKPEETGLQATTAPVK